MFGYEGAARSTRVNRLAGSDGMVGYALDCLREAFYGGYADRMMIVTYEALIGNPADQSPPELRMPIGEAQPFAHDYDNVEYSADDFDASLRVVLGLHTVRPTVGSNERPTILPPELFRRFDKTPSGSTRSSTSSTCA